MENGRWGGEGENGRGDEERGRGEGIIDFISFYFILVEGGMDGWMDGFFT